LIILNKDAEEGFTVLSIDNNKGGEASYWKDRFLKLTLKMILSAKQRIS